MSDPSALASIGEVERRTGVSKDTLRVWEKRYGFPTPSRDAAGDRVYSLDQVEKIRLVRLLVDQGLRPSKIMHLPEAELSAKLHAPGAHGAARADATLRLIALLKARDVEALRGLLIATLYADGLEKFVLDTVAPMTRAVGEEWVAGRLEVFEEHLFTEILVRVLRGALDGLSRNGALRPSVLLTTLPGEPHAIGLLMAECMMALAGASCLPLGIETPIDGITKAAVAHRVDVVALSFSAIFGDVPARRELAALRRALPDTVEIWAGGSCPGLSQVALPGVRVMRDLASVAAIVADWRSPSAVAPQVPATEFQST